MSFPEHIFTNTDLRYPTFLHYSIGILVLPLRLFLKLKDSDLYLITNIIGRIFVLLLGMTSIFLSYWFTKKFTNTVGALLAASWLSFSLYHAQSSVWALTDVPISLFALIFVIYTWKIYQSERNRHLYVIAGLWFGLLVGTKYTGVIAIFPFLFLYVKHHKFRISQHKHLWKYLWTIFTDRNLWIFGIVSLTVFFITTPTLLLHPRYLLDATSFETQRLSRTYLPITHPLTWLHLFEKLQTAVGLPLAIILIVGLIYPWRNRNDIESSIVLMIGIMLLVFGDSMVPRYYIFVLPLWSILAGITWEKLANKQSLRVAVSGWLLFTIVFSFSYAMLGELSRLKEPRTEAANYISIRFSRGDSFGLGYTAKPFAGTHGWGYPKINSNKFEMTDFLESPDVIVMSSYDVDPILNALQSSDMLPGYNWPQNLAGEWYQGVPPSPDVFTFYEQLFITKTSNYCLEKFFHSQVYVPIELPPPDIWIFIRKDLPSATGTCE